MGNCLELFQGDVSHVEPHFLFHIDFDTEGLILPYLQNVLLKVGKEICFALHHDHRQRVLTLLELD